MAVLLSGWLLKKRQESRMLGKKYDKRYFELTADTLAYAKDPKDKASDIEVFSILEMRGCVRVGDTKFEMRFPERLLRVKAETPGEANRWIQAIDQVYKESQQVNAPGTPPAARVAEAMKKSQIVTALTIEAESDDDDHPQAATTPSRAAPLRPPPLMRPISPPEPMRGGVSPGSRQDPNRPPSPRALLANPRIGTMMITSPTKQEPEPEYYADEHEPVQEWEPERDSSEDEQPAPRQRYQPPPHASQSPSHRAVPPAAPSEKLVLDPQDRASPSTQHTPQPLRNALSMAHRARDEVLALEPTAGSASLMGANARAGSPWDNSRPAATSPAAQRAAEKLGRSLSHAVHNGGPGERGTGDVLTLDAPAPARSVPAGHAPHQGSRPASTASSASRLSNQGPRMADVHMDERVELQPHAPRAPPNGSRAGSASKPPAAPSSGARAGSAGSNYGQGVTSARVQSASSSYTALGPAPSSAVGTDHEGGWDDWDSDSEVDDDSAMGRRQPPKGKQGGNNGALVHSKQQAIQEGIDSVEEEVEERARPPPPVARKVLPQAPRAPPPRAAHQPQQPVRSSWDEGAEEEEEEQQQEQPRQMRSPAPAPAKAGYANGRTADRKAVAVRLEDSDELQQQAPAQASTWDDWDD